MARRSRKTLGTGPPEGQPWVWITETMLGCITMRALGIHARRILDFLMSEQARHGGRENGNLAAPYRQLDAWGVGADDVRKGLAELEVAGFVRRTFSGWRRAGGGPPSRYALTWLPTLAGSPHQGAPTHEWVKVLERLHVEKVGNVAQARAWLKAQVAAADVGRGTKRKKSLAPQLRVIVTPNRGSAA